VVFERCSGDGRERGSLVFLFGEGGEGIQQALRVLERTIFFREGDFSLCCSSLGKTWFFFSFRFCASERQTAAPLSADRGSYPEKSREDVAFERVWFFLSFWLACLIVLVVCRFSGSN
jgi:hypothetical protein